VAGRGGKLPLTNSRHRATLVLEIAVRIGLILAFVAVGSVPAVGRPEALSPLWRHGEVSLLRTACKSDDPNGKSCRAIDLRAGTRNQRLGAGYMGARLLWSGSAGARGPDALVVGESGGSGGYAELFAVTLGHRVIVKKLAGERLEGLHAKSAASELRLELPFDIEFFNGAPHAGATTVPIPTIWRDGDFSADLSVLVQPPLSKQELAFRELAVRHELADWAEAKFPSPRIFPPQSDRGTPVTVQALFDLMLTGHADDAHELLRRAWPHARGRSDEQLGGEDDFWKAICQAAVHNRFWRRLRLDRLPHADVIRAGAA
jgi:hypothetical protein